MKISILEPLRHSIKEPIPAILEAWELLSSAVEAHLQGKQADADALFRQADLPEVWSWVNPAWEKPEINVRVPKPDADTQWMPKAERDPVRNVRRAVKATVLARDGYRCRYCGIPVVDAEIRKIAHKLYPGAIPWDRDPTRQHAAFQCFWLQYDHVVPHSHGGPSSEENVVVSCALCNFGKDRFTLRQLGLSDPRLRSPEPSSWDGLERLRAFESLVLGRSKTSPVKTDLHEALAPAPKATPTQAHFSTFFLPGARLRGEYVYTPRIAGRERWFKLGPELIAAPAVRNGIEGCHLQCDPAAFRRRGLSPEHFLDSEHPLSTRS